MPDTGLPFQLPYPAVSDLVRDAPQAFQDLAEQVADYLLFQETATRTTAYTLAIADASRVVPMNAATAVNLTVPTNASVAFPLGTVIGVYNLASSPVTVVGASGVTVRNAGDILQFQEVSLRKRGTDEWVLA